MRNTIRGLEEKVEYFKLKNTEQEERVHQLLRLNSELKGELESSKSKSNEKDAEFYRQQFEFSERNLGTVQEKLKQALEELSYVRNSELAKVSQLNTELAGRLSQTQASIFDLNLKINTSQTEKAYAEDERRQLIGKLEVVNIELKRYKQNEREQSSTIESLSSQL
jgi:chromosome segregation ATPase